MTFLKIDCNQCQENNGIQACTEPEVSGSGRNISRLQTLLVFVLKGISVYAHKLRKYAVSTSEADDFVLETLISTMSNIHSDEGRIISLIWKALEARENVAKEYQNAYRLGEGKEFRGKLPEEAIWSPQGEGGRSEHLCEVRLSRRVGKGEIRRKAEEIDTQTRSPTHKQTSEDKEAASLKSLMIIGLKGIASYTHHALVLDFDDRDIPAFIHEALASSTETNLSTDELTDLLLRTGEVAVRTMNLLDRARTDSYGHPEPTEVSTGVGKRPGILISGHDLRDLEELLLQTMDTGIDVYTHGEMLPAHAYPAFKGYDHFVGNYGRAWWQQKEEFEKFNGPIIITTNCMVPPDGSYSHRLFTTGLADYPGIKDIPDRAENGNKEARGKDFSAVIEQARTCDSPDDLERGTLPIGCGHETMDGSGDSILHALLLGDIKRFFVLAGCDGGNRDLEYFTELAGKLPKDTVILTAGCAKYRFNDLDLGEIEGLPRVMDAGQCGDTYSLVLMAMRLAKVMGVDSIRDLPISFTFAWYGQKAVAVLLGLLYLGVEGIRLTPTLPGFISPDMMTLLEKKFRIRLTTTVDEDLEAMMRGE